MTCKHKLDVDDCEECMPISVLPKKEVEFPLIERELRNGGKMKVFRSGGGLRVVRVDDGPIIGYGEAPQFEEALEHCEWCLSKGGRTYEQMYRGKDAKYPHYLTGTTEASSELDRIILAGNTFRAWAAPIIGGKGVGGRKKKIWVQIEKYEDFHYPDEVQQRVLETGESEEYEDPERGFKYLVSATRFPNGEPCTSAKVIFTPEGRKSHRAWMYKVRQTVHGNSGLYQLFQQALVAPKKEFEEEE
jgi:hypothetical protein